LGYVIDLLILFLSFTLPLRASHPPYYETVVLEAIAAYFYGSLFIGLSNGATIGMKIVRLRCVNAGDFEKVTLTQAFRRSTAYSALVLVSALYHPYGHFDSLTGRSQYSATQGLLIPLFAVPRLLDLFWATWDKRNQTLHDKFAQTLVVRSART
jgi:uncharacterized RDD family membrane protein YckC